VCSDVDWDFHWADRDWIYDIFDNMHLDMCVVGAREWGGGDVVGW
jgi:hypothetical protein